MAGVTVAAIGLVGCDGPGFLSGIDRLSGGGSGVSRIGTSVGYGSHGQRLDIYRPDGATGKPLPVVIFVHGGSWRDGEKGGYAFAGRGLARIGTLAVVIDYRKLPEHRFPDFHEDVAEAVRWAVDSAAEYGGDPENIFLVGHSAGAHIAMLAALDRRYLQAVGLTDKALAGVVGIAGPYDFYPFTVDAAREAFAGADPSITQPVNYARATAPPLLLLHGEDDTTVLPANSKALAAEAEWAGGEVKLKLYPGLGHVGAVTALSPLFKGKAPVLADISAFVKQHAKSRVMEGSAPSLPIE